MNIIIKNQEKFNNYQEHRYEHTIKIKNDLFEENKYNNYCDVIKKNLNLSVSDMNFKSDSIYTVVTQNVSMSVALQTLINIKEEYGTIFNNNIEYIKELCHKNDSIGLPIKTNIDCLGLIALTNIRYIDHAFHVLTYIKSSNLDNIDIIEVGGGYGGLAFFIIKLSTIFNININSYTNYDLPEVCQLVSKISLNIGVDIKCGNILEPLIHKDNSFLVSSYAYSELPEHIKTLYQNNIFKYINHGLIIWNYIPFDIAMLKNICLKNDVIINTEAIHVLDNYEGCGELANDLIVCF
jgi:hypothetical protein